MAVINSGGDGDKMAHSQGAGGGGEYAGRRFRIYEHPELGRDAVKVGFCWPAFIFFVFYALFVRRLAYRGVILFFGILVPMLLYVSPVVGDGIFAIALELDGIAYDGEAWLMAADIVVFNALAIVMGLKVNEWKEEWLADNGFTLVGVVACRGNKEDALAVAEGEYQKEKD